MLECHKIILLGVLLPQAAYARHYTTLTKVNVRHTNIGSLCVLAIMQNCSQLLSLGATNLLGEDIVANHDKPWAFTGLQRQSVDILLDWVELSAYKTQVRGVFQKLGELMHLEFNTAGGLERACRSVPGYMRQL
ncbi:hypothetical protein MVEG_05824 [Podila verticillata NRRL 6337]|nr:hypothetical protein MVEG_05824 [Podila verticillata NRRL 6337]